MNLSPETTVLIQGIADPLGAVCLARMQAFGTKVVAGVSPGCGGQMHGGVPVFDLVEDAVAAVGPVQASVSIAPPYAAVDAALEAIAAGIRQLVMTTANVPPLDVVRLVRVAEATDTLLVGPNSPGIAVPGQMSLGLHSIDCYTSGSVGILSRSSTLAFEVSIALTQAGLGQSIAVCLGADRLVGSSLVQWLQILDEDDRTEVIVLLGEGGGDSEMAAAKYVAEVIDKPVVAYIAGRHVPADKLMGHTRALRSTWQSKLAASLLAGAAPAGATGKIAALQAAQVKIADRPAAIPDLVKRSLGAQRRSTPRPPNAVQSPETVPTSPNR